jgi:hypothetical protein
MVEPEISFISHVYEPMRSHGLCLPDAQVIDIVRAPDMSETLTTHADTIIRVRASGGTCGVVDTFVLVVSSDTPARIDVYFSVIVPAYLRELASSIGPAGLLRAFASRFGMPLRSGDRIGTLLTAFSADVALQVIDDGTTPFLLLTEPSSPGATIVPFALAIDLERYTQWLIQACPDARKENVRIELLPRLKSEITGWRLLDTSGMIMLGFDQGTGDQQADLTAFSVTAPAFSFKAGIRNGAAFLERNGARVEAPLAGPATGNRRPSGRGTRRCCRWPQPPQPPPLPNSCELLRRSHRAP